MKYKRYLIILLAVIIACLSFGFHKNVSGAYFNLIIDSLEKDSDLGRQITKRLTFGVNEKQFIQGGKHIKYVLKDAGRRLYVFKIYCGYGEGNIADSILSEKFSSFCGLLSPALYDTWLPVNGRLTYGVLQEIVTGAHDYAFLRGNNDVPHNKDWIDYYLFRWLIGNKDIDWQLSPKGEIINKDMDTLTDSFIDFDSLEEGNLTKLIRLSIREGSFDVFYGQAIAFIGYIEAIPDDIIVKLCGPYGYKERINMLLLRKSKLRSVFQDYCQKLAKEEGKTIKLAGLTEDQRSYAKKVLTGLKERIAEKKSILKRLPEKKELQRNIDVISSRKIKDFSGICLMSLSINKIAQVASQRIEELKVVRENTDNFCEALALSMYINQYEQFIPFYPYGIVPAEEIRFIISPKDMDPKFMEANLCLGYSRDYKPVLNKRFERFLGYSTDDMSDEAGNFIDLLSGKEADKGWNYIMRGNCYLDDMRVRDKSLAFNEYQKVVSLKDPDSEALYLAHMFKGYLYELGDELFRFGPGCDLDKAEEEFELALMADKRSIPAHLNLLAIYLKKGDFINAKVQISLLALLDPYWKNKEDDVKRLAVNDTDALAVAILDGEDNYVMSLAYLIKGNYNLAKEHLSKAMSMGYNKGLTDKVKGYLCISQ